MKETLQPLLDLLGGHANWIVTIITWLGVLVPLSAVFSTKFKHWVSDQLNDIAASRDKDDDAYLTKLFSAPWYRITAFILRFTPFHLPTLADLERAIEMQKEEVTEATAVSRGFGSGAVKALALLFGIGALMFSGCGGMPVQVKAGADPIVVIAEWTAENALNSIDQFLAWEKNNEAELLKRDPGIHRAADELRDRVPAEVENLRALTKQYKKDKSDANGEKVKAAGNLVLSIVNSARQTMGLPPLTPPKFTPSATDLLNSSPTNGPPAL